jgi:hypothetical protein
VSEIEMPTLTEKIADPLTAPGRVLGRDPFDDLADPDPFEEQLDQLEARRADSPVVQQRARKATARPTAAGKATAKPSLATKSTTRRSAAP